MTKAKRVCLGAFAGAFGVRGEARVKTFTEQPESIAAYGPVETEDRIRTFSFKFLRLDKSGFAIVAAPEIKSREDAEGLKGVRLYVDRARLPPPQEDEFYLEDLKGLAAIDETGAPAGRVAAVYNFGAGDLLELADIPGVKGVRLIPFTKENAPSVDLAAGVATILRAAIEPEEIEADPQADAALIKAMMREEDA